MQRVFLDGGSMSETIRNLDPKAAEELMAGLRPDEYTLLDVRQPWEYEEFHLPGAMLIPLPELVEHLDEIEPKEPILVYCRAGGRSMAAAKLLAGNGYTDVYNLQGGAAAWLGSAAYGPMDLGLIDFSEIKSPGDAVARAFDMENNLQNYYLRWVDTEETESGVALFAELARFEEVHKDVLYRLYSKVEPEPRTREEFEAGALGTSRGLSEGGVEINAFLEEYAEILDGLEGILMLGMMIETQAYDYYIRCARASETRETREAFEHLAREELAHLKLLGLRLDGLGEDA